MVKTVWQQDYSHLVVPDDGDDEEGPAPKRRKFFDPFDHNDRRKQPQQQNRRISGDEYESWCANDGEHIETRDPVAYWHERRHRYPRLSRMALDFLTVQAMSAECERLFSASGRMISPQRTLLDAQIVSMCQVLRSWYRAGLIQQIDPLLLSIHEEEELVSLQSCGDNETVKMKATAWLNGHTAVESDEEVEEFTTGGFEDVAMGFKIDETEVEDEF